MTKTKAQIGTVSHGTMRAEDLIPDFSSLLAEFDPSHQLIAECNAWIETEEENRDQDLGSELVNDLFDALNEYAPDYCYFGAHEGDGSDYGFWVAWDSLDDDARYGEVLKVSDTSEVPTDYSGTVYHVNDHRNATLYSADHGKLSEVWSVV